MDRSELSQDKTNWPAACIARTIRVLLIDGDQESGLSIAGFMEPETGAPHSSAHTYLINAKPTLNDALCDSEQQTPELVLADLGSIDGIAGVKRLKLTYPNAKLVTLSGQGSLTLAIDSMHAGAWDFLTKPVQKISLLRRLSEFTRTLPAANNAVGLKTAQSSTRQHQPEKSAQSVKAPTFEGFCGTSDIMVEFYRQIQRIAPSQAPVFIYGPSGSGKDLCAQAVHNRSKRSQQPFVALNCRSIPHYMLENELFGRSHNALSGNANGQSETHQQIGLAEQADGGTLYLDEITELDLSTQAKLLSFLQTGTIRRSGDIIAHAIDVRIICATSHNIRAAIAEGRFREDLFYRLHVLPVKMPALLDRREDVNILADHFLANLCNEENRHFGGFSNAAYQCLQSYSWPGNVRELQNAVRHAVVMNEGPIVEHSMLPPEIAKSASHINAIWNVGMAGNSNQHPNNQDDRAATSCLPFWKQEQAIIEKALLRHDGNISRAAAALEISPSTIYRKRQSWMDRINGSIAAE